MVRKSDAEPLLSAVARKLGHAAGTLANLTHMRIVDKNSPESDSPLKFESAKPSGKKQKRSAKVRHAQARRPKPTPQTRAASPRKVSERKASQMKKASKGKK